MIPYQDQTAYVCQPFCQSLYLSDRLAQQRGQGRILCVFVCFF